MEQFLDRFNKLPLAARLGGVVAIVLLITAGVYFGLIQSVEEQIDRLKGEQASLDHTLAEKKAIADNLNDYRREMDQLDQRLQDALTELPEEKEMDQLLSQLSDVAKKSGVEIGKITPGGETPESFYSRIPISVTVGGNYHEIAMFLQEISNLRRIVNVNNIHLVPQGVVSGDKITVGADFVATTFRFVEKGGKK
jgi:type IV pilus assembly protein PilO